MHLIVVSIPKQRISALRRRRLPRAERGLERARPAFPTPIGVFSVIQKNRYHRSNIYSGAPMPFMQRITWSGVAMHEGVLPGYPASHGCIRLTHKFASELWGMTRMGVRVVVTPDDAAARCRSTHAKLPAPNMTPAPTAVTDAERIKPSLVAMAGDKTAEASAAPTDAVKLLSPLERAKVEKAQMVAEAPAKAKAAKEAAEVCGREGVRGQQGNAALREAERRWPRPATAARPPSRPSSRPRRPKPPRRAKADQGRGRGEGRGGHARP